MSKLDRRKPYKAAEPLTTIGRIQPILADCGLFVVEHHYWYASSGVHGCRLTLGDEPFVGLDIGVNGKGMTARYALASGYAELMERLQNQVLFHPRQQLLATRARLRAGTRLRAFEASMAERGLLLDFLFDPAEQWLAPSALVAACEPALRAMLRVADRCALEARLAELSGGEPWLTVPFLRVSDGEIVRLPAELMWWLATSNGMCAGNTREEALVQGLSELCERHAIRAIYEQELTPPTIPLAAFAGTTIHERLCRLAAAGDVGVTVKDCSLGLGLPVLGLLLVDRASERYIFHLGADPCPATALERCFTEIYQGDPEQKRWPLPAGHDPFAAASGMSRDEQKWRAYYRTMLSGEGAFPASIFDARPSYPWSGFDAGVAESDRADLDYLVRRLHGLGFELYARDASFLGFPALQIYVPGMSENDYLHDPRALPARLRLLRALPTLVDLAAASPAELQELAASIEEDRRHVTPLRFEPRHGLPYHLDDELALLDCDLLLSMLHRRTGRAHEASAAMDRYCRSLGDDSEADRGYYLCVRDALELEASSTKADELAQALTSRHGAALANEVLEDLADPAAAFTNNRLPRCFDCDACTLRPTCRQPEALAIMASLKARHAANPVDPASLREVFAGAQ